jgi:hypothetical protein
VQAGAYRATVTVYRYQQPLRSRFPSDRAGFVYAGIDVHVCLDQGPGPVSVSWEPWSLIYPDDTTVEPVHAWSDDWFSVPLFPGGGFEKLLHPGRCVSGWALFEVREKKRPIRAEYSPTDADGNVVESWPSWRL